ncbi:hypothetical protein M405DRAFT_830046, partial [Rhizopogon salebrosus TDB-379]
MYILTFNQNRKAFLDVEITAQRRNTANRRGFNRSRREVTHSRLQSSTDANSLSYIRLHGIRHFFNRMRPSADTERKQRRQLARRTPEFTDVPFGQATVVCCFPGSFKSETHLIHRQHDHVAGEEDGVRPYSIFFCLGWFQKKLDLPRQLYDVDL